MKAAEPTPEELEMQAVLQRAADAGHFYLLKGPTDIAERCDEVLADQYVHLGNYRVHHEPGRNIVSPTVSQGSRLAGLVASGRVLSHRPPHLYFLNTATLSSFRVFLPEESK